MFRTIFSLSLIQHQVIIEANPELSYGPITAISNSLVWQISPAHASLTHPYRINNFAMSYGRLAKSSTSHDWHFYLIRMTTWVAGWGGGWRWVIFIPQHAIMAAQVGDGGTVGGVGLGWWWGGGWWWVIFISQHAIVAARVGDGGAVGGVGLGWWWGGGWGWVILILQHAIVAAQVGDGGAVGGVGWGWGGGEVEGGGGSYSFHNMPLWPHGLEMVG